jgi:predicted dehydrogenase
MKRVAIVGFGFMGKTHYGAWKKCRGAKVVAVCDSNLAQLTAKVDGNIKGVADNSALPATVKVWDDFAKMLEAGGFDIVDITLPTSLHPEMTVAALEAGFHVLCEKPMALDLKSCDRMLAAAAKAKRELLVAHCVRFFPEYACLREMVRSGRYGKVVAADFTRFMSAPKWSPKGGSWLLDEFRSGGVYVDAHVHDADCIVSLFGMPGSVFSRSHRSRHGYVDHTTTVYGYPDMVVTADSSFAASDSLEWDAAARVFFEKASVYIGPAYKNPVTVYPQGAKPFVPKLSRRSGYEAEVAYFLDMVEGREIKDKVLTAEDARNSIALVLAERSSAESGKEKRIRLR